MPLMKYKAMDERGKITTGRMAATNVADLDQRLRRLGLDLIRGEPARAPAAGLGAARIRRRELIGFFIHLELLLSAGVPMLQALTDLRDSVEHHGLREVIGGMAESIQGGKTLSGAMQEYPRVFDRVLVNLVRAGEVSGRVAQVLRSIVENLKWRDEQAAQLKQLMVYPTFAGSVVLAVLVFLMTTLVPQLVSFIQAMGGALPIHTTILIRVSHAMVEYWYLILLVATAASAAGLVGLRSSVSLRHSFDRLKLRLWLVGPISKKIVLARFANYFALMYASGIAVLECVRISEALVGNLAVAEATRRAGREIADGASISAGFEHSGLFPPLVVRMLRVGENTGALDSALLNICYFYERDVKESMDRLRSLIGPTMTMVLGGLLLWVIISVLGPIYGVISEIDY